MQSKLSSSSSDIITVPPKLPLPKMKDSLSASTTLGLALAASEGVTWGRKSKADSLSSLGAFLLIVFCPTLVVFNWIVLQHFDGSILAAFSSLSSSSNFPYPNSSIGISNNFNSTTTSASHSTPQDLISLIIDYELLRPSWSATKGYAFWLLGQALLYRFLPGKLCYGQLTPGGNLLGYITNGLSAWVVTHVLFVLAVGGGWLDPAAVVRNWPSLLVVANAYGFGLAALVLLKGYWTPSFPEDRKMTGSWIFDFWGGVELNPRFGKFWDIKFFHQSRPGIIAWTLIDLSCAAHQYQTLGTIAPSLLTVLTLQTIYVLDLFAFESWYTRTLDITHDHFGFMLAWGDTTFLPAFYTLPAQYLAFYPYPSSSSSSSSSTTTTNTLQPSPLHLLSILTLGLLGYSLFRSSNSQRDAFRAASGKMSIWGKPATFLRCKYKTADGREHESLLLTSGWWGVCRHSNYLGDLVMDFSMCAPCGFERGLPWLYFGFKVLLLVHRARRDERRCGRKYGGKWEEYCRVVQWRLVPGIW